MINILSWNIRGLGARIKRSALRKMISIHNPLFITIQETKLGEIDPKLIRSIWNSNEVAWTFSPADGNAGGILTLWSKTFITVSSSHVSKNWIAVRGTISHLNWDCSLISIYNPCSVEERAVVWGEILEFWTTSKLPCLIIGDFNETLASNDRGSLAISQSGSNDFRQFVQSLQLTEIPTTERFTWFRGNSKSKLDRCFVNPEWLTHYPTLKLSLLNRGLSDHCPLLLNSSVRNWGPKPFKFQNCWLSDPRCMRLVKDTWQKSSPMGLVQKLKTVKKDLKDWNEKVFGNIEANIKQLEHEINQLDKISNERDLDSFELEKKKKAQVDLWSWMKTKESYWSQQSRIKWLKQGDRNTKFFHVVASIRKHRNSITSIEVNGDKISEPEKIKLEAMKYFRKAFKEESYNRPLLEGLDFKHLTEAQSADLIAPFSHEEIDKAVASCSSDKAPGPDGFNFTFIKKAWDVIKEEIYETVQEFWNSSRLPKGCNMAFIALIPKTDSPKGFQDFRPISMVGCVYKIVAKLLTMRLQKVMNSLVGPAQSSFIEGRHILDSALIAGELIDSCKRWKTSSSLLKIDFHKAFDSVSWAFLDWTLEKMNFPIQWRQWIQTCVTTASSSVLINGSPSPPFKLQKGLRQGDPLSPFLFVLVVETLNLLINKAISLGFWEGVEVSKGGLKLSHLQYADDTLIFCAPRIDYLQNIKKVLILFHLASGLQINFHKSSLIGINVSNQWMKDATASLLCKGGSLPFNYLGLPIGGDSSRIKTWEPILERISKKLDSWKGRLLSIGGRVTLIKSSISSLPLYFMSLFPIPRSVIEQINKLQRHFLWSGDRGKRALSQVAWKVIELPKAFGGLGIGNIFHRNLALLFKWIWKFFNDTSPLWRELIWHKYKYKQPLTIRDLDPPRQGGPWQKIVSAIIKSPTAKAIAINGVRSLVGDGALTLFWHDQWLGPKPLKAQFPRLYLLATNKMAPVASHCFWDGLAWAWSFSWARHHRARDLDEKEKLLELLDMVHLDPSNQDSLVWSYHKSGSFSTSSFTAEMAKANLPPHTDAIKGVWVGLVPHRVEIFVWMALLGRINTRCKLASIGIIPQSENICVLCNTSPEQHNHLLLHCPFSLSLWNWWLDLWRLKWVLPETLRGLFDQWLSPIKTPFFKKVWAATFFIISWSIWKERNSRIFENTSSPPSSLHDLILLRLGWWISGWDEAFPYSPTDIQRNPQCLVWGGKIPHPLQAPHPSSAIWTPPDHGSLKWNVDASYNPLNHRAAVGGVLRNHLGHFICVFSVPVPPMEINFAEVLAIHRALSISHSDITLQSSLLVIESDSANAVSWCNAKQGGPWNLGFQLNFIRSAGSRGLKIEIIHKGRSSNQVADALAKQGLSRRDNFIAWL
uniref:Reverse transcriptase domain-containing protein n=1 Tax=Beta vulgaris subsp. vulgaris TaxID=3555 RepID=F4NCM4_BETVV|nr:hypothetical protein [Beta vulgaris subsp. vulgaris]